MEVFKIINHLISATIKLLPSIHLAPSTKLVYGIRYFRSKKLLTSIILAMVTPILLRVQFMNTQDAKKRIQKLRSEIERLRNAYHIENSPNVTDEVYDSLTRELKDLLKKYSKDFKNQDEDAPENRVAGKPLDKFKKVKHATRMLSLNDAFSYEELYEWEERVKKLLGGQGNKVQYFCEV